MKWVVWIALASSAYAEPDEAKRYFRAGAKAYEAGQYEVACRALERAFEISPLPAIAFSLAQAYRLRYFADANADHLRRSKALYERYLADVPKGGRRHDAATALAEIEPLLASLDPKKSTVTVLKPPTQIMITSQIDAAQVTVDGGEPIAVPATVEVKPGPHDIRVFADGYFEESKKTMAADGLLVIEEIELREKPALVTLESSSPASIYVDAVIAGTTPLARPLEISAGSHSLTLISNGSKRWDKQVEVTRGGSLDLKAELGTTGQRYLAWTAIGVAAGCAALGTASSIVANAANIEARDLNAERESDGLDPAQLDAYEDAVADRRTFRIGAGALYSGAIVLGLTGLLLYLFDTPDFEAGGETIAGSAVRF
jgi:tetratricopeptide (TPR) repeat protein